MNVIAYHQIVGNKQANLVSCGRYSRRYKSLVYPANTLKDFATIYSNISGFLVYYRPLRFTLCQEENEDPLVSTLPLFTEKKISEIW